MARILFLQLNKCGDKYVQDFNKKNNNVFNNYY